MPLPNRQKLDAAFDAIVAAADGQARPLALLAATARQRGDLARAVDLAQRAAALAPDDRDIASIVDTVIAAAVPKWHFGIVRDDARNAAYQAAIDRAVTPGCHVLDVGTGSGLLAMMAARAGAGRVHTCEENGALTDAASRIIAANGYADRVTLIAKNSGDIDIDADMGGRADIIVSEIVGKDLVCEHVLPAMRDAVRRLLKPGGRMIPHAGAVMVALGWSDLPAMPVGAVCGFDLSAMNALAPPLVSAPIDDPRLALRGPAAPLFAFDFMSPDAAPTRADTVLTADGSGPVNGVLQWIRLTMDDVATYENRPGSGMSSSWYAQFLPFPAPLDLAAGAGVRIAGAQTHNRLRLWRPDDDVVAA